MFHDEEEISTRTYVTVTTALPGPAAAAASISNPSRARQGVRNYRVGRGYGGGAELENNDRI
jgi:hypothetical protein